MSGFDQPVDMAFIPSSANNPNSNKSSTQVFIAQKQGQLAFADLQSQITYPIHEFRVRSQSEMGLLGIAFHPEFPKVNKLFVNYNPKNKHARTRISSFDVVTTSKQYTLANESVILEIDQPYRNHNGGQVAFGPDGYLYIGMGDGGSRDDPQGHSQNLASLLGAMLRIDINVTQNGKAYGIPKDNPFINNANARDEIWAYGLRNPWRFSFSPQGSLIAADVGQNAFEEVSVVGKGDNLGWNIMEGFACFKPKDHCLTTNLVLPKNAYARAEGRSITGGFVYTGTAIPALKNHYIYGDYIKGNFWAMAYPTFTAPVKIISDARYKIVTFAQDFQGEIFAADIGNGTIYQLAP